MIAALAAKGVRAKVRTGGLTVDAFPSSRDLARFLSACANARVPFKATRAFTTLFVRSTNSPYEPASPSGLMHGSSMSFSPALCFSSAPIKTMRLRRSRSSRPPAFHFDEAEVRWHSHRLTTAQLRTAREQFAISFGSCSFEEPIDDLKALGWL